MTMLRYVTHPEVEVDPDVFVDRWHLSERGRLRVEAMLAQPWVTSIGRIVSTTETKAIETAELLATHLGLDVEIRPGIGENDRSATGFVPPAEFTLLADQFFANPGRSIRGWERAIDAQARVVAGLGDLLTPATRTDALGAADHDIAVVGHGAVGTLWYCHLDNAAIDRRYDQPGQGHYFTVDLTTGAVMHRWRPIDQIDR